VCHAPNLTAGWRAALRRIGSFCLKK
jgi:hypothetical protein